jgi:F-type H+-transporting ATPase subunit alpha
LAGSIRLSLAQYRELAAFAQFASDLDEATRKQLSRGQRFTEILKQKQYMPMTVAAMALSVFAVEYGYVDDIELNKVTAFEQELQTYAAHKYQDFMKELNKTCDYNDQIVQQFKTIIEDFKSKQSW